VVVPQDKAARTWMTTSRGIAKAATSRLQKMMANFSDRIADFWDCALSMEVAVKEFF
jgi:hypothetical protein